jgi:hypothetical protein
LNNEYSIPLPPITSLLLSRAKRRSDIPNEIYYLREEFKKSRLDLWDILNSLWSSKKYKDQINIGRKLENAANSIYSAAFPQKYNSLSIALDFAQCTTSGLASGLKQLLNNDIYNQNVKAVSFTNKLTKLLRKDLENQIHIYDKHFTDSELASFGKF